MLIDFILRGGPVMWPIIFISVVCLGIIMEKIYTFRKEKVNILASTEIENFLKEKKRGYSLSISGRKRSFFARLCSFVIENYKLPPEIKEELFSQFILSEIGRLGKNLRFLGIMGHVLPLLGLFGTVTGMIKVFMVVERVEGSVVNPQVLAGGIWEALLTTAAGLAAAIPTLIAYHYFEGKLEDIYLETRGIIFQVEKFLEEKNDEKNHAKKDSFNFRNSSSY